MDDSQCWKMTIVGGVDNGKEYSFPADSCVKVGRSHGMDVRISKRHGDVSRQHVEFSLEDGRPVVRNISEDNRKTKVDGIPLPPGERSVVASGVEVALGETVRIRVDGVPYVGAEPETDPGGEDVTSPTCYSPATDEPTYHGDVDPLDGPTEVVVGPLSSDTVSSAADKTHIPTDMPTQPSRDTELPTDISNSERKTDDIDWQNQETVVPQPNDVDDPPTPIIDPAVIDAEKRKWNKKLWLRRVMLVTLLGLIALGMYGFWYFTRNTREIGEVTIVDDVERFAIRDAAGNKLLEVDYPAAPKRSVTPSPDNTGVTVISYQGRERDVPFFLQLETLTHPDELKIDLLSSVRRWLDRTADSGEGLLLDRRVRDELKVQFVEDVYPESCETESLYGVRFVEFEYKRTWSDESVWHGCAIYLRRGDSVYLLRREIPEELWDRGGYRLKADPNLAVYANFATSYWESPGANEMPVGRKTSELMDEVRSALAKDRAADWRFVRRDIDALLARSWRTDSKTRDLAMSFLRQFRERQECFYYGKYNALQSAKETAEREPRMARVMNRVRLDAQVVFDDSFERYYSLVRNPEVW